MFIREDNEAIFVLEGVWHIYPGSPPVEALRGIDLSVRVGEYIAVIGANGSGKSTLARHLNALLLPTQGSVRVAGIPTDDPARRAEIRRTAQMVFQQPDTQIVATTVEEDVAFGLENFGVPEEELAGRVQAALEMVGMWEQRSRPPHLLSAGQKQRVVIAGALAVQPRALILDEATAMLDPAGRTAVIEVLHSLQLRGTTIITITHEMEEAARAARIIVLDQGKLVMDGTPYEIFGRAEELRRLGLDVPPLADLALRLGLPVCLTVEDLLDALDQPPELIAGRSAESTGTSPHTLQEQSRETERLEVRTHSEAHSTTRSQETVRTSVRTHSEGGDVEDVMIEVEGLYHTYLRGTPLEVVALRGVDLQAGRGAILGLIGQTGSGKSTLMQHLNGLMRPQAGHVIVDGEDWADPSIDVREVRRKVGLLFQQPEDQLFERYVGDDVAFGPRQLKLDSDEVRRRVRAAMEATGLPFEAFKDRLTQSLSGGERRRAALAGVLALQPEALAADEPTAGLDPRGRAGVLSIFRDLNREGVTIIIGSHRMEDIVAICDQVVALRDGRVAASGPLREVLGQPEIMAKHGLPPLPLAVLASELREAGWPVPEGAITIDEIAAALAAVREN